MYNLLFEKCIDKERTQAVIALVISFVKSFVVLKRTEFVLLVLFGVVV